MTGMWIMETAPAWLRMLAGRVHKLIQSPSILYRFRTRVETWARERPAGPTLEQGDRVGAVHDTDHSARPSPRQPIEHQYAVAAAIHDALFEPPLINPWNTTGAEVFDEASLPLMVAGLPYRRLVNAIAGVDDAQQPELEAAVNLVHSDIIGARLLMELGPDVGLALGPVYGHVRRPPSVKGVPDAVVRLEVHGDEHGAVARVGGTEHPLTGEADVAFLKLLIERNGVPLSAKAIKDRIGERPDRILRRLPKGIRRLIAHPTNRGNRRGYALKMTGGT